jgi:hypothetical protein
MKSPEIQGSGTHMNKHLIRFRFRLVEIIAQDQATHAADFSELECLHWMNSLKQLAHSGF